MSGSLAFFSLLAILVSSVSSQPSPDVQERISNAIRAAGNQTNPDYTAFVNPFIGTGLSVFKFRFS